MSNKQVSNPRHYWEHTGEQDRWMNYVLLRVIRNGFLVLLKTYGAVKWAITRVERKTDAGSNKGHSFLKTAATILEQPDDDEDDEIDLLHRQNIKSMTGTSTAFSSQPPRFHKNMTVHPTPSLPRLALQAWRADRHLKYSEFDALKWG
ncbi:hypothetical protein B0H14DRAFT_2556861 [Mycena olivaceomarginata]|nr:hypothetical protein B0H14DRAFT_2556861 [Mycena olivaceomarginata]